MYNQVFIPISYDGSDEDDIEMVPENNNLNNNYNIVRVAIMMAKKNKRSKMC